jgi:hypothetical protein
MKRKRSLVRDNQGYGLVAVMMISFIGMLFLYGLAAMGLNLSVSERVAGQKARAQRSAELAFNYVMKQFTRGEENIFLPQNDNDVYQTDLAPGIVPGADVKVRVRRFNKEEISRIKDNDVKRILYRDDWDPNGTPADWVTKPTESYFWMIQVTAVTGGFASSLQASISPADTLPTRSPEPRSPGVVSSGQIRLGDGSGYLDVLAPGDGFSSEQTTSMGTYAAFKTALQSNSSISVSSSATVYGDLMVNNESAVSEAVAKSDNALVFGRLQTNASDGTNTQGFTWTNNSSLPSGTDNVWAMADAWQSNFSNMSRQGANYSQAGGPISEGVPSTNVNPTPMPTQSQSFPGFPSDSSANVSDLYLAPGSYATSSLDSSTAASRVILNSSTVSGLDPSPTKIYINSDMTGSSVVNLDTNFFVNEGKTTDLQIYYAGDKDININLVGDLGANSPAEFKGVIYAPRAKVSTTGSGEFYGAILAKEVAINHTGDLRIDPAASSILSGLTSQSSTTAGSGNANSKAAIPKNYKVNTWQQIAGRLVQ